MKNKVILLDMDDTINKFNETMWETYNTKYNDNVNLEDVKDWDIAPYMRKSPDPYSIFKEPGIFRNVELKDGAQEFVANLMKHNQVYMVTDSPAGTGFDESKEREFSNPLDDKKEWVKEHFPEFPLSNMIVCAHKWMVNGDVLLDDKPHTFEKMWEYGKPCILMSTPYNKHIKTEWRARDLEEADFLLRKLFKNK